MTNATPLTTTSSSSTVGKRSRDAEHEDMLSLWESSRFSTETSSGFGARSAQADVEVLHSSGKTPLDFFGARKEWSLSTRESYSEQQIWSKFNPVISYCEKHDRFTGSEVPSDLRDKSCYKCIKGRTSLMVVDYHKLVFPCSSFTKEGREQDKNRYIHEDKQMKELSDRVKEGKFLKNKEEKIVMDQATKVQVAWHAYALQIHNVGEEIRGRFPRDRLPSTPEEKKDYDELVAYIKKGINYSFLLHRENVFKVKCLLHNKITNSVPISPMDKYDKNCELCLAESTAPPSSKSSSYGSGMKAGNRNGAYERASVDGTSYYKLK